MMVRHDHFNLTYGGALIKFLLCSAFALSISQAASASVQMHTKDINGVTLGCKGGEFIVSLNNDDDDKDGKNGRYRRCGAFPSAGGYNPCTRHGHRAALLLLNYGR